MAVLVDTPSNDIVEATTIFEIQDETNKGRRTVIQGDMDGLVCLMVATNSYISRLNIVVTY